MHNYDDKMGGGEFAVVSSIIVCASLGIAVIMPMNIKKEESQKAHKKAKAQTADEEKKQPEQKRAE